MLGPVTNNEFDVTDWIAGIYMIKMKNGGVQKLIVAY